jgi:CHAD domain-containing protein
VIADQGREMDHLREQLAAAEARDGSLFDLNNDRPDLIGRTIIEHVSIDRAQKIIAAMQEWLKKKRELRKGGQSPPGKSPAAWGPCINTA